MKLNHDLHFTGKADAMAFAPDFYRLLGSPRGAREAIAIARREEVEQAVGLVNRLLKIADGETVEQVRSHNPEIFRLIRHGTDLADASMMAYLPLNARGLAAIIDGVFDGLQPDLAHICRPGEQAEAMYLWLVYAPQRFRDCLQLIEHLACIGAGTPIFSRPVNPASQKILTRIGFTPGRDLFPDAAPWLECLLPHAPQDSRVDIHPVTSIDHLLKVMAVRSATYIAEQSAPYTEEFDGNDFCGTHLLGTVNGEPAGCARIRYFGDFAKFERFAIRRQFRHTPLLPRLARACIAHAQAKGFRRAYAHARTDLVPLWQRYGARPIEGRPPFRFSGIEFREMVLDLDRLSPIAMDDGPFRLNRPEGYWSEVGPLDHSVLQADVPRAMAHASSGTV